MNFRKLLMRISLLAMLCASLYFISYSCGWSEDECDSYVSFVNPNIVDVKNASPFYYTPNSNFYECMIDTSNLVNDYTYYTNNEEWKNYTSDQTILTEDIERFINQHSYDTLAQFYQMIEKGKPAKLPSSFLNNSFSKWFTAKKDLEALGYILYAKECEPISTSAQNEWEAPQVDSLLCVKLIKNGKQLYTAAKHQFIKERYALQLIKTAFYASKYKELLSLYDTYYIPVKGEFTSVDTKIYGYKAGALFRSKQKAEAAYMFSKLFDESNDFTMSASHTLGFVWSYNGQKINDIISYCKNDHEKAIVYALSAMRNTDVYSLESLNQVYELEPSNKYIDVILLREINKIEQSYLEYKIQQQRGYYIFNSYHGNSENTITKDDIDNWLDIQNKSKINLLNLATYVESKANENKLQNKSLWLTSAAYLHLLKDDIGKGGDLLKQAEASKPTNKVAAQIRILKLIHSILKTSQMSNEFETQLASELKWFESYSKQNKVYHKNYKNLLRTVLPLKYAAMGDSIKMVLCYHKYELEPNYEWGENEDNKDKIAHFNEVYYLNSGNLMDRYFSQTQLDAMKNYVNSPKTTFDQWLCRTNQYSSEVINELKSVKYFRSFEYEKAKQAIVSNKDMIQVPNLFVAHIRDYQDGYDEDTLHSYTTYQVLDTLINLKKRTLVDMQSAFDYACALYSLSYHGKCHDAWSFSRSSSEIDPYYRNNVLDNYTPFEKQFYYADEAFEMFQRVLKESTNIELKEKSLWMLAKCQQKRCSTTRPEYLGWYDDESQESKDYINWNVNSNQYLAEFYNKQKGTAFYEEVYQECSYLRLFAKKQ